MKIYCIWVAWERLYKLNYNIPPLGILRVAGETPERHTVVFTDEMVEPVNMETDADIVALSFLTPSAPRAYELAAAFRSRGRYVVCGGTHATIAPEEVLEHADTVFAGESEGIWPRFLEDMEQGRPGRMYRREDLPDLRGMAPVRRELLPRRMYPYENPVLYGIESMELSRGCCSRCAYCLVPETQGSQFRNRPMEEIHREFLSVEDTDGIIFFTDNNLLGNWEYTRRCLEMLAPMEKDWFGLLAPEDAADDPGMLRVLLESGLCGIYGTVKAITGIEPAGEMQRRRDALQRLADSGVVVIATFALGWDSHDSGVFDRTLEFCFQSGLRVPEFIINTPFPGSRLYRMYRQTGRIISRDWAQYNGNHCVFRPAQMTPEELEMGYHACYDGFYRETDRDRSLFEAFRDRVFQAMLRSRRKRKAREEDQTRGHQTGRVSGSCE